MTTTTAPRRPRRPAPIEQAIRVRLVIPVGAGAGGAELRNGLARIVNRLAGDAGYVGIKAKAVSAGVAVTCDYRVISNDLGGLEAAAYLLETTRELIERAIERGGKRAGGELRELIREQAAGGVRVSTELIEVPR